MRIAYISAGAGAMYCGACTRDANLARGIRRQGHDIQLIPLYTPLKDQSRSLPLGPIFFGGINVYLQQACGLFRHVPRALDRMLDSEHLLRWVSEFSIEVDPRKLGPMTVSMLEGRDGKQKKELSRLLDYLEHDFRPDVVHLTNALLSGIAPELKRRLNVPVLCTYQGEDNFIGDLPEPHRARALELVRHNATFIDHTVCPCQASVPTVEAFMGHPRSMLTVIRTGIPLPPETDRRTIDPFTIGHLSGIRPAKGLDLLIEALRILVHERGRSVKLLIGGRVLDTAFWKRIGRSVRKHRLDKHVVYLGELPPEQIPAFHARCSVFCVPSRFPEPRGVAVLEAMAAAVPVIAPDSGTYPELISAHGGGMLVRPSDPLAIADAVDKLMKSSTLAESLGRQARNRVAQCCGPDQTAVQTLDGYKAILSGQVSMRQDLL